MGSLYPFTIVTKKTPNTLQADSQKENKSMPLFHASRFLEFSLFVMILTLSPLGVSSVVAQQSSVVGQTEREIRILQERSNWARTQISKAQSALATNDFESAYALSKSAVDALPSGGDALKGLRPLALETFSKSAVMLAQQRISEGRFEDAQLVVSSVTGSPYDSTY